MRLNRNTRLAAGLALLGALSACQNMADWQTAPVADIAKWQQIDYIPQARSERVLLEHSVRFRPNEAIVDPIEQARFDAFVARSSVGHDETVLLAVSQESGGDPVGSARLGVVGDMLTRHGLFPDRAARPPAGRPLAPHTVLVTVRRDVLIEPDCNHGQPGRGQRPQLTFGCANAVNLGRMVADPADLRRGKPLGPGDAEFAARSVERYRKGETEELIDEATTSDEEGQ